MIGKSPVEAPSTNQSSDGALLQMIQAPQTFYPVSRDSRLKLTPPTRFFEPCPQLQRV